MYTRISTSKYKACHIVSVCEKANGEHFHRFVPLKPRQVLYFPAIMFAAFPVRDLSEGEPPFIYIESGALPRSYRQPFCCEKMTRSPTRDVTVRDVI
ncbi:hypothetical protein AVEN_116231-1 [Araneus ventricosus]|uniref:Uncharacterized protein n=1 Tax=Araneus ventricosus TaxID=182803 RepID=A0A4Y2HDG1_ARAVE|nr:hypothetical protein AVEN_116231-1 [Araneus ventricosus]